MLNRAIRYMPAVSFVSASGAGEILEVGSGSLGLGEFLERGFTGCDVEFGGSVNPNLIPVRGSALALPFRDSSYDLVLSVDMLEHIKKADRAAAVRELFRVSRKYVFLSCPCGRRSDVWDRRLLRWLRITGKTIPAWLQEHCGNTLPEESEIFEMLGREKNIKVRVSGNENVAVHAAVILMELTRGTDRLTRLYKKFPGILRFLGWLDFPPYYRRIFVAEKTA